VIRVDDPARTSMVRNAALRSTRAQPQPTGIGQVAQVARLGCDGGRPARLI